LKEKTEEIQDMPELLLTEEEMMLRRTVREFAPF
jgi:hypothetical protein